MVKKIGASFVPLILLVGMLSGFIYWVYEGELSWSEAIVRTVTVIGGLIGVLLATTLLLASIMWAGDVWKDEK